MDLKQKRKEIRKEYFPREGIIIVTFLCVIGIFMVKYSGVLYVENYDMLYNCIAKNGILVIGGSFFIFIFLYCLLLFIRNIIIRPKREVLYLLYKEKKEVVFVSKKGKKFECDTEKDLIEEHYYTVLKTYDYIYDICEESSADWIPKVKMSYWLNFYSPMGYFEDLLLLPIVYVLLIPGVLSFLMCKGYEKLYVLVFVVVPLYFIVYDLIYKIKNNK